VITPSVDDDFHTLPLRASADAALQQARDLGAQHADVRIQRTRRSVLGLHDSHLAVATDETDLGIAVRVLVDGVLGFAATTAVTPEAARRAARDAMEIAVVGAPLALHRVELAPAPAEPDRVWTSRWRTDPFLVARNEQVGLLEAWSARLLASSQVTHVDASLVMLKEQRYFADAAGSSAVQQRILLHPEVTAVAVDREGWRAEAMRTLAPPAARGWEYVA
jgi:TldD protein